MLVNGACRHRSQRKLRFLVDHPLHETFFSLLFIFLLLDVLHELLLILSVVLFSHAILPLLNALLNSDDVVQDLSLFASSALIDWVRLHCHIRLLLRMLDQVLLEFTIFVSIQTICLESVVDEWSRVAICSRSSIHLPIYFVVIAVLQRNQE